MDSREARVARNEAMYRAVNREIEHIAEGLGENGDDPIEVLCECGQPDCQSLLSLSIADYDRVHSERDRFVVARGHVDAELERLWPRRRTIRSTHRKFPRCDGSCLWSEDLGGEPKWIVRLV